MANHIDKWYAFGFLYLPIPPAGMRFVRADHRFLPRRAGMGVCHAQTSKITVWVHSLRPVLPLDKSHLNLLGPRRHWTFLREWRFTNIPKVHRPNMPYPDVHAGSCHSPLAMCTGCNIGIFQDNPTSERILLGSTFMRRCAAKTVCSVRPLVF